MGWSRFSVRSLIVAVAVVGFDAAAMTRALQQGRAAHAVREYAIVFGLVLLVLNLDVFALLAYYAKAARSSSGSRLNSTPPPLVIAGTYLAVLAIAILSVLFLSSGLF
jgi:uncharacterized membrane protein YidH (DUF202 family)